MVETRAATIDDSDGMSQVLREIIAQTGRDRPHDRAFVTTQYIANPASVRCTVATDDAGRILGFQSLVIAAEGNRYDVPAGWGVIGTHISPRAHRNGIGRVLFLASRAAAQTAELTKIDAAIAADNASGLAYYEAIGFRTWRASPGIVQKVHNLEDVDPPLG